MLLNLGLTADAAAAHANEPINQPEPQPSAYTAYSPTFFLSALPLLNSLCGTPMLSDGTDRPGLVSAMVMSPIESTSDSGSKESASVVARPRVAHSTTGRRSRPKTSYQFAHPAAHARHKRFRFRPKLLLQLQQVSQTPRPLPVVDVLPSTSYLPLLARKFPAIYRTRNGLGPYDLIVVLSEQYDQTGGSISERRVSSEDEDEDHREVVATICQKYRDDAQLKGKAEICMNFGPIWEASPLPSGTYEFVAQTDSGVQIVRWALRCGRSRRMSGTQLHKDGKRFTFSVIDPTTRRHPVLASMTRNKLEINDEYSTAVRSSGTGPATPSSGMSVVSDGSDAETPLDGSVVTLDDGTRTLIIVTGIWVAFREGWSDNFRYGDPSSSGTKSITSSTSVKYAHPTTAQNETDSFPNMDEDGKRRVSSSNIRRSTTPTVDGPQFGSLSKRSNSTGAAFMDRAKRRSASGLSTRLNRHSMFTALSENGREIVVSRPPSPHQHSGEIQGSSRTGQPKAKSPENTQLERDIKSRPRPDRDPASNFHITQHDTVKKKLDSPLPGAVDSIPKGKIRRRLSTLFGIFHRKQDTH
ncbi:hypothetical protein N7491_003425 [Penicillium cf. griseofulvum]|uniref:Uncharacterized protein n=1 Tax=Penicillium cf. griseofulvum TaxID=2972120 RepID=A0A9W9MR20_9EURO|nr:hypothetical protein N7472_002399 [Penicillium cf. griseofulvum]KAJ5441019.1 hypothetical protein N7491_003425 [Penicillium cf. griseofulvum]KAJ5449066.1 hypothetical protein N7445_003887 [Penicillium cf. griseofulvum]